MKLPDYIYLAVVAILVAAQIFFWRKRSPRELIVGCEFKNCLHNRDYYCHHKFSIHLNQSAISSKGAWPQNFYMSCSEFEVRNG